MFAAQWGESPEGGLVVAAAPGALALAAAPVLASALALAPLVSAEAAPFVLALALVAWCVHGIRVAVLSPQVSVLAF
jgi:hypothetical protein